MTSYVSERGALDAAQEGKARALRAQRVQLWKQSAEEWLRALREDAIFAADNLVEAIGKPDEGDHRANAIGAIISSWSKRDLIVWTGYFQKSERVEGHGNLQRIWRKCSLNSAATSTPAALLSERPTGHAPPSASSDSESAGARSSSEQLDLLSGRAA